jgi:hypothetical protein
MILLSTCWTYNTSSLFRVLIIHWSFMDTGSLNYNPLLDTFASDIWKLSAYIYSLSVSSFCGSKHASIQCCFQLCYDVVAWTFPKEACFLRLVSGLSRLACLPDMIWFLLCSTYCDWQVVRSRFHEAICEIRESVRESPVGQKQCHVF